MTFKYQAWERLSDGSYKFRRLTGPLDPLMLDGELSGENSRTALRAKAKKDRAWTRKWEIKARNWELTSRVRSGERICDVARDLGMGYCNAWNICRRDGAIPPPAPEAVPIGNSIGGCLPETAGRDERPAFLGSK